MDDEGTMRDYEGTINTCLLTTANLKVYLGVQLKDGSRFHPLDAICNDVIEVMMSTEVLNSIVTRTTDVTGQV